MELVELLVSNGASINVLDKNGYPIHALCEGKGTAGSGGSDAVYTSQAIHDPAQIADYLLSHGAEVNSKNKSGRGVCNLLSSNNSSRHFILPSKKDMLDWSKYYFNMVATKQ